MPTTTAPPVIDFLAGRVRILADGDATAGALGLVEMVEAPPGDMPPLHVHHVHDEGFYLLEGELTLYLPGERVELTPGEFVLAPRGIPHSYRVGDAPARWLVTSSPAGFEQFVAAVSTSGTTDPAELGRLAAEHGIEILGPPGMLP
jgi:quercetin dioxygenase-like cupin family protein